MALEPIPRSAREPGGGPDPVVLAAVFLAGKAALILALVCGVYYTARAVRREIAQAEAAFSPAAPAPLAPNGLPNGRQDSSLPLAALAPNGLPNGRRDGSPGALVSQASAADLDRAQSRPLFPLDRLSRSGLLVVAEPGEPAAPSAPAAPGAPLTPAVEAVPAGPCPYCGSALEPASRGAPLSPEDAAPASRPSPFTLRALGPCAEGFAYEVANDSRTSFRRVILRGEDGALWRLGDLPPGRRVVVRSARALGRAVVYAGR